MLSIWRIVKTKYVNTAFDGEGARLFGGRWNHEGTPIVYCSETLSLAAMEVFVHLDQWSPAFSLSAIKVNIPKHLTITSYDDKILTSLFKKQTAQSIGTQWANENKTAILKVPSAIVPHEHNFLLNPLHPDFKQLSIQPAEPFQFDKRMWK